jgi:hypothetical protein
MQGMFVHSYKRKKIFFPRIIQRSNPPTVRLLYSIQEYQDLMSNYCTPEASTDCYHLQRYLLFFTETYSLKHRGTLIVEGKPVSVIKYTANYIIITTHREETRIYSVSEDCKYFQFDFFLLIKFCTSCRMPYHENHSKKSAARIIHPA